MIEQAKNICIELLRKVKNPSSQDINNSIDNALKIFPNLTSGREALYNYLAATFSVFSEDYRILDTNEDYKLNLNLEKNHSPEMLKAKLQKISANNLKGVLSENDLAKYINTSNNERIKVKIYEYFEIVKLHKGKYFGDVALEKKNNLR